jgi:hypothetical protein
MGQLLQFGKYHAQHAHQSVTWLKLTIPVVLVLQWRFDPAAALALLSGYYVPAGPSSQSRAKSHQRAGPSHSRAGPTRA